MGLVCTDTMTPTADLLSFCKRLPKIELHAHINGSISTDSMRQLAALKKEVNPDLASFKIPERFDKIDDFFPLFKYIYRLTDNPEAVRVAVRNIIDEFAADGVRYLELRTTPRQELSTGMTKRDYLSAVLSVIHGEPRSDIEVRLIVSIDRRNTLEEAYEAVALAEEFRSQGVVGIDLCGDVMKGSFEELKGAFLKAKSLGFKTTLHFNEVAENIPEAPNLLSIDPDRLGHATLLDDESRAVIYKKAIPVEICMTSNVLCKTVKSFEDHHVKDLLQEGHPFVLCTDDKGVFFSELSNEYAICATTFRMTKQQLFDASLQAIDAIFENKRMQEKLKAHWNAWHEENREEILA